MAALSVAQLISFTDKLTASYLAYAGGDPTTKNGDLLTLIIGSADYDVIGGLADAAAALKNTAPPAVTAGNVYRQMLAALDAKCKAANLAGVVGLDTFAAYYNIGAGGPYAALFAPDFLTLYAAVYNGANPNPANVYAPAIASMGSIVRTASVNGSYSDGAAVDTTKYAGQARLQLVVAGLGGTGVVTVNGTARTAAGVIATGRTWTVNVSGNGTVNLVPTVTGDIATDITGFSFASGVTDGTFTVNGLIPSGGRSNPPS